MIDFIQMNKNIENNYQSFPMLAYADLIVVDEELKAFDPWKDLLTRFLVQNAIAGYTLFALCSYFLALYLINIFIKSNSINFSISIWLFYWKVFCI